MEWRGERSESRSHAKLGFARMAKQFADALDGEFARHLWARKVKLDAVAEKPKIGFAHVCGGRGFRAAVIALAIAVAVPVVGEARVAPASEVGKKALEGGKVPCDVSIGQQVDGVAPAKGVGVKGGEIGSKSGAESSAHVGAPDLVAVAPSEVSAETAEDQTDDERFKHWMMLVVAVVIPLWMTIGQKCEAPSPKPNVEMCGARSASEPAQG